MASNPRGEWLRAWADKNALALSNTWFKKPWDKIWTHTSSGGRNRQIYYIMVERAMLPDPQDAEVTPMVDIGFDHKAVRVAMTIQRRKRRRRWRPTTSKES